MSFKVSDKNLLKRYLKIWKKISSLARKNFDNETVCCDMDKYIKTKIKPYGGNVTKSLQDKKIPEENTSCKCFSLIMLNSVIKVNTNYYPQTLLEKCKYSWKSVDVVLC